MLRTLIKWKPVYCIKGIEGDTEATETSETVEETQATETPKDTEDTKVAEASEAVADTETAEAPETVENTEITEAPEAVEAPEIIGTIEIAEAVTDTNFTTEAPEEIKKLQGKRLPLHTHTTWITLKRYFQPD